MPQSVIDDANAAIAAEDAATAAQETELGDSAVHPSLDNGPYIKNGMPNGRPRPTGKRRLVFELDVYRSCADSSDVLRDPNTLQILDWKPGQPRSGLVDFGHKPGLSYNSIFDQYRLGEITLAQLKAFQYDPNNFQIESPSSNRGHKYE